MKDSPVEKHPALDVSTVIDGALATITLRRAHVRNALDLLTLSSLVDTFQNIANMPEVNVVVLQGDGPAFCAGGDIGFVIDSLGDLDRQVGRFLEQYRVLVATVRSMRQVIVAAVHGPIAGAGLALALTSDICVASTDTQFIPAYAALGVSPDCGASFLLTEAIGWRSALAFLLLDDRVDAQRGLELGLASRLLPKEDFAAEVHSLSRRIAGFHPVVLSQTKKLMRQAPTKPFDDQMAAEGFALLACMQTPEYRKAIESFAARRSQSSGKRA